MTSSLRVRLLLWLLVPLAVFSAASGASSYRSAQATAALVEDRALLTSAQVIANQVQWDDGTLHVSIPPAALELFASPEQDKVYLNVQAHNPQTQTVRLLAGSPRFPLPPQADGTGADAAANPSANPAGIWYDTRWHDQPIRAVAFTRTMYNAGATQDVTVLVGKTTASHDHMVSALWRPAIVRQLMTLLLASVLVVVGLTVELRPILKLKDDVIDRNPMQLVPIQAHRLQSELRPVVDAINQCIQRLNFHVSAQRRFIAAASHQLRTPLTLLNIQLQFARQNSTADTRLTEVLQAMQTSSRKMADLTNKLLLLAQAEASEGATAHHEPVDLGAIVLQTLEALAALAEHRQVDLGIEPMPQPVMVTGNPSLLLAMTMNLVDNALRYTPLGGIVTVSVTHSGDTAVLEVLDNGPGIPAEARLRIFERFYRAGAQDTEGTGLGLAIVQEIVNAHRGNITLSSTTGQAGLRATVRLPLASTQ